MTNTSDSFGLLSFLLPVQILGCLFLILSLTKGTLYTLGCGFSAVLAAEKPWPGGRLQRWGRDDAGGKAFDIDFRWAALALPDTLNQAHAFASVQLCQQLHGFVPPAVQVAADLIYGVVDVDAPGIVVPLVLDRQRLMRSSSIP